MLRDKFWPSGIRANIKYKHKICLPKPLLSLTAHFQGSQPATWPIPKCARKTFYEVDKNQEVF